jgi:hypothetical protein
VDLVSKFGETTPSEDEAKFLSPVKVTFFSYIVGEKQEQDMHHCKSIIILLRVNHMHPGQWLRGKMSYQLVQG